MLYQASSHIKRSFASLRSSKSTPAFEFEQDICPSSPEQKDEVPKVCIVAEKFKALLTRCMTRCRLTGNEDKEEDHRIRFAYWASPLGVILCCVWAVSCLTSSPHLGAIISGVSMVIGALAFLFNLILLRCRDGKVGPLPWILCATSVNIIVVDWLALGCQGM